MNVLAPTFDKAGGHAWAGTSTARMMIVSTRGGLRRIALTHRAARLPFRLTVAPLNSDKGRDGMCGSLKK